MQQQQQQSQPSQSQQQQQPQQSNPMNPNPGGGGGTGPGTMGTSPGGGCNASPAGYQSQSQQMYGLQQQQQQPSTIGHHQQQTNGHHHDHHHRTSHQVVSGGPGSSGQMFVGIGDSHHHHQTICDVISLSEHTDDENDLFQCGKCKQQFCHLAQFVTHKKTTCPLLGSMVGQQVSSKTVSPHNQQQQQQQQQQQPPITSTVMSHAQLHHQPQSHHHHHVQQQQDQQLDLDLSHLILETMHHQPDHLVHHHHHHHQRQPSPTLTEAIGGHSSVNSILSETDLLSLTPSLDAQMMVTIGNSISPSSMLHLQGGDVSANTDDFAQFRLTPTPTESIGQGGSVQMAAGHDQGGLFSDPTGELHHHHHHHHHHQQEVALQSPQSLVNSLMNSLVQNTSPTSFASLIQNLSSTEVGVPVGVPVSVQSASSTSNSLLPDSNENSNSIGSPSRFLNIAPPPRTPSGNSSQSTLLSSTSGGPEMGSSTPLRPSSLPSIVEHHPAQQQQQQQITNSHSLTVIHHHPSNQQPQTQTQLGPTTTHSPIKVKEESQEDQQTLQPLSSQLKAIPPNVTIQKEFDQSLLVKAGKQTITVPKDGRKVVAKKAPAAPVGSKTSPVKSGQPQPQQQQQQAKQQVLSNVNCFPCNYCDRSFPKHSDLQNHMPCHTGEKPFQCLHCGKAFSHKSNLRKHIQTHKISRDEMRVIYKNSLEAMATTKRVSPAKSGAGGQAPDQKELVNKAAAPVAAKTTPVPTTNGFHHGSTSHVMIKTEQANGGNLVPVDGQPGSQSSQPQQPQQQSTPIVAFVSGPTEITKHSPFACPLDGCPFEFTNDPDLLKHFTDDHVRPPPTATGEEASQNPVALIFKCVKPGCDEELVNPDGLLRHLQLHNQQRGPEMASSQPVSSGPVPSTGPEPNTENQTPKKEKMKIRHWAFRCDICLNRYTTEEALEHHKQSSTHHFPCPKCDKVFPCERYLRRHVMTHGGVVYNCQFCDKSFKTANYLKVHLVIHTGEKPFACSICDAAFNRRDKLKRHELVHDPVKRYKCPNFDKGCTREFNRPDKLKAHILTHSGIKPYQCSKCDRSFTRRAHLREHFKTHDVTTLVASQMSVENQSPSTEQSSSNSSPIKPVVTPAPTAAPAPEVQQGAKRMRTVSSSEEMNPTTEEDDEEDDEEEAEDSEEMPTEVDSPKTGGVTGTTTTSSTVILSSGSSTVTTSAVTESTVNIPVTLHQPQQQQQQQPIQSNFILVSGNVNNMLGLASSNQQQAGAPSSGGGSGSNQVPTSQQPPANTTISVVGMDQLNFINNIVLVYPCAHCDKMFLKESELKAHQCSNSVGVNPQMNPGIILPEQQQQQQPQVSSQGPSS